MRAAVGPPPRPARSAPGGTSPRLVDAQIRPDDRRRTL